MAIDYTQTEHYGLDKYGDKSPADLRDGFNHNMDIIDDSLKNNADNILKKADKNNVYDKAEIDNLLKKRDNWETIVFIGDSISTGEGSTGGSAKYSSILSNRIGLTEKNYAVGGSGFVNAPTNGRFDIQARIASQDTSYDHALVKYIIVQGGVNDDVSQTTTALQTLTDTVSYLKGSFKNATIYVATGVSGSLMPGMTQGNYGIGQRLKYYQFIQKNAANMGCVVMNEPWKWISFEKGLQNSDRLHPNDYGHAHIANCMYNSILGQEPNNLTGYGITRYDDIIFSEKAKRKELGWILNGDTITLVGNIGVSTSNDLPANSEFAVDLATLPPFMRNTYSNVWPTNVGLNGSYRNTGYIQTVSAGGSDNRMKLHAYVYLSSASSAGTTVEWNISKTIPAFGIYN